MNQFEYSCATCAGPVRKPETGSVSERKVKSGLHGWRCQKCGPTKVIRRIV